MSVLGQLVVSMLPLVPRQLIERFARPYVAGDDLPAAVQTVRSLMAEGCSSTIDVLGEEAGTEAEARALTAEYLRLLDAIAEHGLDANVSVKLSGLGLWFDAGLAEANLRAIVSPAAEAGNFVRIDMEDSSVTDATLELYRRVHRDHDNLGVVLQSALKRTTDDADGLAEIAAAVRMVKGIYVEPEAIAHRSAAAIRQSYLAASETLIDGGSRVAFATHDAKLVTGALELIERKGLAHEDYEFQLLLGVRPRLRRELVEAGHRVRIYVPYGEAWYAYSMRRLRENPAIALHVANNIFTS